MRPEGEHRRAEPPPPRGRAKGQPLSRGEAQRQLGVLPPGKRRAAETGRSREAARPPRRCRGRRPKDEAPSPRSAHPAPPRPAPPARPPRRGRRAAPGPAAAPPQGREAWRPALQCPPPPAPHSHQLPPVRPSSSFFSEFQMNFFQLPSPSLAFPRAMVSGRGAAGESERRIGRAPAGTPRPGLGVNVGGLPPALRGDRRRWPGGTGERYRGAAAAATGEEEESGAHRARSGRAPRPPRPFIYTAGSRPPAARPMGAGGGARGRGAGRGGRGPAGGVGLVRGSCGARARAPRVRAQVWRGERAAAPRRRAPPRVWGGRGALRAKPPAPPPPRGTCRQLLLFPGGARGAAALAR